jgi:hypothetical protein
VVFAEQVMFPQGCLWHDGWVYVAPTLAPTATSTGPRAPSPNRSTNAPAKPPSTTAPPTSCGPDPTAPTSRS